MSLSLRRSGITVRSSQNVMIQKKIPQHLLMDLTDERAHTSPYATYDWIVDIDIIHENSPLVIIPITSPC